MKSSGGDLRGVRNTRDTHRRGLIAGGIISQLTTISQAPALNFLGFQKSAGVRLSGGNLKGVLDALNRRGRAGIEGAAGSQLSLFSGTPTFDGFVFKNGAGMRLAQSDLSDVGEIGHSDGDQLIVL